MCKTLIQVNRKESTTLPKSVIDQYTLKETRTRKSMTLRLQTNTIQDQWTIEIFNDYKDDILNHEFTITTKINHI